LTLINTTVENSEALFGGGISAGNLLTVQNSTFITNTAANSGGAIYAQDATVNITGSLFDANTADNSADSNGGLSRR
jgi:predicted outer membrane repeat protein